MPVTPDVVAELSSVDCSGGNSLTSGLGTVISLLAVQQDADLLEGRELCRGMGKGWIHRLRTAV